MMKQEHILDDSFDILFLDHPMFGMEMTPSVFSLEIEKLVKNQKMDYLDATCLLCEKFELDYASVPKLLTKDMKDKIELAAIDRKYRLG